MKSSGVWAGICVFLVLVPHPTPVKVLKGCFDAFCSSCSGIYATPTTIVSIQLIGKKIFFFQNILDDINWPIFICLADWYSTIHISFLKVYKVLLCVVTTEVKIKKKTPRNNPLVRCCMWYYIAVKPPRPSYRILRRTVILESRGGKKKVCVSY